MEPIEGGRPGVQPQSAKRNAVGWRVAGRSGGAAPFFRVALAIAPTLCQQHGAAGDDHMEHGQHVRAHAKVDVFWAPTEVATTNTH